MHKKGKKMHSGPRSRGMVKLRKLTSDQKASLAEHQKKGGHGKKHMASMRMRMMRGDSLDEAHKHVAS